jgi:hypothetical protein
VSGIGAEFEGVAVKALIEVDGGGEGALEGGDAVGGWRQGFAGQEDDGGGGLLGVMDAMAAQEFGEAGWLDRRLKNWSKMSERI